MLKKIGGFFEEHVEKIVLVLVGILSFILFLFFVLKSPNAFEYVNDEGKTEMLSPSAIDERIYQEAVKLSQKPSDSIPTPDSSEPNEPRLKEYLALLDSSVGHVSIAILGPDNVVSRVATRGPYIVPENIGIVTNIAVEHIRAAAYVPIEPVTEQRTYDQVEHEPNDIDLVTIQGEFDVAGLVSQFDERFVDQVPEEWADPCLVKPVFASVHLQRRELRNDGTWSEWQNVPRATIDHNKKVFELIQDDNNLPPGLLQVQKLQFDNPRMQMNLLQPQAYQFASAREEWYPPVIHRDYTTAIEREMQRERQEARDAEKQERSRDTTNTTTRGGRTGNTRTGARGGSGLYTGGAGADGGRSGSRRGGGRRSGTARGGDAGLGYADGTTGGRSSRRRGSGGRDALNMDTYGLQAGGITGTQASPLLDVYRDFNKIQLTYTTDLTKMRDPLVFWAHDDTVEPEMTYQYKVRLGVFNPVAQGEQDRAIIWSDFSDETTPVDIPGKLYFFANRQETAKTVALTVYKYFLGYWRSEDFRGIGPGGAIGAVKEYEPEEPEEENILVGGGNMGLVMPAATKPEDVSVEPELINFDTGAVVIDVVAVDEWTASGERSLSNKSFAEILYSFDGANIEHMPVSSSNWPERMKQVHNTVQRLSKKKPEPFKQFGSSRSLQQGSELYPGGRGAEEEYMFDEMGMGGGRY